jgi:hypothetical protein
MTVVEENWLWNLDLFHCGLTHVIHWCLLWARHAHEMSLEAVLCCSHICSSDVHHSPSCVIMS